MEIQIHKEIFSKNLNYYLKEKGYNQSDLLKEINVSKSTMSSWCRGTRLPRMHHIQALADYLNIEKSMLIEVQNKDIYNVIDNIKIILNSTSLNEEDTDLLISYIEEGLELIKKKNNF